MKDKEQKSEPELGETFFFLNMEQGEKSEHTPLVNQLTGILPPEIDTDQEYRRFLEEKQDSKLGQVVSGGS